MGALCTPGGLRAAPEREDLRLFVESIATVNGTTVATLLREKMVSIEPCTGAALELSRHNVPSVWGLWQRAPQN